MNRSRSRETNTARLWGKESTTRFAKDGIGDCVLHGADTVNPAGEGTKGYAAWDLAFHCIPLAIVDPDFAKSQIDLMLWQDYLHPTGQMPAYEWNFGDVNPPVHAFATLFLQRLESELGEMDLPFLQQCFERLLLNFTWWVNRKDPSGRNVFEGGFLGLDNIGVFDRSAALPTGGRLEQADGTAWMAMFS